MSNADSTLDYHNKIARLMMVQLMKLDGIESDFDNADEDIKTSYIPEHPRYRLEFDRKNPGVSYYIDLSLKADKAIIDIRNDWQTTHRDISELSKYLLTAGAIMP